MRTLLQVFALAALIAVCRGFPGARRESAESLENDDDKVVAVLGAPQYPFFDFRDEDTDFNVFRKPTFLQPVSDAWSDTVLSLHNMLESMRRQAASFMSRVNFGIPWSKIPEGANSTSTTKIIDGHVVTVNETTYSSDANGNVVFRIHVIDVKPQDAEVGSDEETNVTSGTTAEDSAKEQTTMPTRSVETVEDFATNEIPKSQVDTLNA